ncbi:MAG: hypothetical protein ABR913_04285 [Sedimentisphaerales bacterium]|jgi:hypothetical protein
MNPNEASTQDTGNSVVPFKTATLPFAEFEITIKLGPSNEFLGILAVATKKEFLSLEQRIKTYGTNKIIGLYDE